MVPATDWHLIKLKLFLWLSVTWRVKMRDDTYIRISLFFTWCRIRSSFFFYILTLIIFLGHDPSPRAHKTCIRRWVRAWWSSAAGVDVTGPLLPLFDSSVVAEDSCQPPFSLHLDLAASLHPSNISKLSHDGWHSTSVYSTVTAFGLVLVAKDSCQPPLSWSQSLAVPL